MITAFILHSRVYLFGGAQAKGTSEDAVVVYTPAILDEGIYLGNLTLQEGYFWSDVIAWPGEFFAAQQHRPACGL